MAELASEPTSATWTDFQTSPPRYKHWKLDVKGPVARLALAVQEEEGQTPDYLLKMNSYDLSVDIELSDALQRLRFEHPEVRVLVITSAIARIFCAGANIYMLGRSTHAFKVNFCKFTNETRIGIEDLSEGTGVTSIAALNGTAAGGGYELALACDEIYLVDDGNSAVSFPEVPLLGVLPGTGGLTRLVDKRKVRRDRADIFCTIAEGVKGRRAREWGFVDDVYPKSAFDAKVEARIQAVLQAPTRRTSFKAVQLEDVEPIERSPTEFRYQHVNVRIDLAKRSADIVVNGPSALEPITPEAMSARGSSLWAVRAFRELDDALLHLRMDLPGVNVVTVRTKGSVDDMLRVDAALHAHRDHGFVREVRLLMARVLRRFDLSAKTFYALIEPGSCFAGTLFELAVASDRAYMLDDGKGANKIALSPMNFGAFQTSGHATRLQVRFLGTPKTVDEFETSLAMKSKTFTAPDAESAGLVTLALDDLDYEDETRLAIEERASLSPDALTGMEASLRFPGGETLETKIFARLSAWQNWIFQRPNAVGPTGALTNYGKPTRPVFDYRRT